MSNFILQGILNAVAVLHKTSTRPFSLLKGRRELAEWKKAVS